MSPPDLSAWQFTAYFRTMRQRPDRASIAMDWILQTASAPEYQRKQADGRYQCWRRIHEAENRWLRVVLLTDGKTIHNAFFDRGFKP
ncbi:MAG: hypothetical protein HQL64_03985 [Magnetococcales bacterium]|nr:hypothetical protein [Magnetococcales bacterium]